jgi:protein-tyrosine-phosphatase
MIDRGTGRHPLLVFSGTITGLTGWQQPRGGSRAEAGDGTSGSPPRAREITRTVLFVCEFNSCRSQLAEAIARHVWPPAWRTLSAGLVSSTVSDEVVRALVEANIDASTLSSKSVEEVRGELVDEVIVLAEPARHRIRQYFPDVKIVDWSMADPMRSPGGSGAVWRAVCRARDTLLARMRDYCRAQA